MTKSKRPPGLALAMGSVLFLSACGGGNTSGDRTNAGTGTSGTGNLGLTGGGNTTMIPGGVPGQTISPDSACVSDAREGEQIPIDLYFMVDKTGSMMCPTGKSGDGCASPPNPPTKEATRWSEMSKALSVFVSSPDNAGIGAGIAFFPRPDPDAMPGGGNNAAPIACAPAAYEKADVEIGLLPEVAVTITTSIGNQVPAGSTPTVASLTGALTYAAAHQIAVPSRRVALVYATDGIPQGCPNNTIDAAAAIAKSTLTASSIPTYVLGVGPQLDTLNQIAVAGGAGKAYLIDTGGDVTTQLAEALHAIRSRTVTCDYHIPRSSAGPLDFGLVNVVAKVGGTATGALIGEVKNRAGCEAAGGGWYYDSPTPSIISLCPATCSPLLATPNSHLQVLIGCQSAAQPVN